MHNLMLATGPGTPASIMYAANLQRKARRSGREDDHVDTGNDEDDDDDDDAQFTWTRLGHRHVAHSEEEEEGDEDDDYGEEEDENPMTDEDLEEMALFLSGRRNEDSDDIDSNVESIEDQDDSDVMEEDSQPRSSRHQPGDETQGGNRSNKKIFWKPDFRHGGCINTACWMSVPWRLAAPPGMAASQNSNYAASIVKDEWGGVESCPTQLATSGDDRVVKLWDARNAMGTANPMVGGWDTYCPLSTTKRPAGFRGEWKKHYQNNPSCTVAGSIVPLATIATGHRGNVFDVAPLPQHPGKMLTCAADGFLRLVDVQAQSSSVIIDPLLSHGEEPSFLLHSGLAFSHKMLNAQTGLLCSDRGLHLFDLRLSPREQTRQSLLGEASDASSGDRSLDSRSSSRCCKACAVWRPSSAETESHYVFAGGSSAFVDLYDLRVDGSRRQVVESYKPRFVLLTGDVSVSGLDVSKDGRELLVSYESDQIYSFPILGEKSSCPAGPTLDEIDFRAANSSTRRPVSDAMVYGGHLNRFTFLKNARYAGPHDEYICTGSDSGHAWIMERDTGAVVSLMSADTSTCNGVVPHPSLPFFITYGIDSTARLWRATPPIDPSVNDSREGRAMCLQKDKFEMSPVAQNPKAAQMLCSLFKTSPGILPDFIASRQEISASGKFSAPNRRGMVDYDSPRIGNAYKSLPQILRSNRYECYRTAQTEMAVPIDSHGLCPLTVRTSICRLRHQAERLGVSFSFHNHQPWNFRNVGKTHPADLVPDHPSDWILLDERMTTDPLKLEKYHLNWKNWSDYLLTRNEVGPSHLLKEFVEHDNKQYSLLDDPPIWLRLYKGSGKDDFAWPVWDISDDDSKEEDDTQSSRRSSGNETDDDESEGAHVVLSENAKARSQRYLFETSVLLKEGGNEATKDGQLDTAARRYDKSIQYCSVAFMRYFEGSHGELAHLKAGLCVATGKRQECLPIVWSPLLWVLITSRLNMALLLLKPRFSAVADACSHAVEALRLLSPFTARRGAVVIPDPRDREEYTVIHEDEPEETYKHARALQAKGYFRLGSAEMEQGDWSAAVDAFQASICCSDKPDSLVTRRLQEAKIKHNSKKKRDRKRFEVAMSN